MSESPSPLQPRHIELLREARDAAPPGPEVLARARARLAALPPLTGAHGHGAGSGAGSTAAGSMASKAAIAVTSLLVGGAGGAGLYAELRPPPAPRVVYVPQAMVPPVAPAVSTPPSAAPTELPASAPTASAVRGAPLPRTFQLAAERMLLDEARGALGQGDPGRALDRLERHRRTFATPILGEERDAMEVEALAKLGRSAEARAKADAFRRRTPNSLFLPAVESAVESIP